MSRFGSDEISLVSKMLMDYALQPCLREQRSMAESEAFGNPDRFTDGMLVARASMACEAAFLMWFTFERPIDEKGGTLVDCFLRDVSGDLTRAQHAYVERLRRSHLHPYEVLVGSEPHDIAVLRDLWTDDIVPLGDSVRARDTRGAGMAFARATIGQNDMPELLETLAMPRVDLEHALLMLRIMHHDFREKRAEPHDDDFFKSAAPLMLRTWLN